MVSDHLQPPAASTPGKSDPGSYWKRGSRHSEEEKNLLLLQESRLAHILIKGNEENAATRKHIGRKMGLTGKLQRQNRHRVKVYVISLSRRELPKHEHVS
jgi:hypothetical protein